MSLTLFFYVEGFTSRKLSMTTWALEHVKGLTCGWTGVATPISYECRCLRVPKLERRREPSAGLPSSLLMKPYHEVQPAGAVKPTEMSRTRNKIALSAREPPFDRHSLQGSLIPQSHGCLHKGDPSLGVMIVYKM